MSNGTVQARIAGFEGMAKLPKVKNHISFSTSGQVPKMISLFETKKADEKPACPTSTQLSVKVIKLASTFGPTVDFGDNERVAGNNFLIPEGTSEMRKEDLNAQFSLVTPNLSHLSPQHGAESDFDMGRGANHHVATHNNIGINLPATKQKRKSRILEFRKKEKALNATSLCVDSENASSFSFHDQKSGMKTCTGISGKSPKAPFAKGAHKPDDASKRLMESEVVDEIQPNTDNSSAPVNGNRANKTITSKKIRANTGRNISLKIKTKNENIDTPASRETTPETEAKTGRKVLRRSRNERNSGARRMLLRGLRALKRKMTRQAVSTEPLKTNQGVTQDKTCMITIESASPIGASWKT